MKSSLSLICAAVAACGFARSVSATTALPYSTSFESSESFAPGSINGQNGWATFGTSPGIITTAAAHTGTQSLLYAPLPGDGDVVKLSSPITDPSGETPSVNVPTPASSYMATDFWFRTVSIVSDPGLYISTSLGNPASVRNTWLGILEGSESESGTAGNLYVGAIDYSADGNYHEFDSPALAWGQWYHVTVAEQYVNGPDNDLVTYSIADAAGNPVWSTTIGSWENYYATNPGAEQAPGPVVSDRDSFGGSGADGGQGIYVDDFSVTNVAPTPEPASVCLLALGGAALLARRRRTV